MNIFLIATGGALGALSRHYLGRIISHAPISTFCINILASILLGLLIAILAKYDFEYPTKINLFIAVGFLGSFSTFSTYISEIYLLIINKGLIIAIAYACSSVILSLLSFYLALKII